MGNSLLDKAGLTRKICPVIFLLDTSGSMDGQPIGALNSAMEAIMPELESMNKNNADTEIQVAALTFQTDAAGNAVLNWVTGDDGLQSTEGYKWTDVEVGYGTPMGAAFTELEKVLHVEGEKGIMNKASGSVAPVLFLLSDGMPTDDYHSGLVKLQENNWYKVAARVAIGYGESNDAILREFTKNPETVKHTNNVEDLKALIQFVTITSSMVASSGKKSASESEEDDDTTNAVATALQKAPPKLATTDEDW